MHLGCGLACQVTPLPANLRLSPRTQRVQSLNVSMRGFLTELDTESPAGAARSGGFFLRRRFLAAASVFKKCTKVGYACKATDLRLQFLQMWL